jgi:uncharacterized protein (TIGR02246 family)
MAIGRVGKTINFKTMRTKQIKLSILSIALSLVIFSCNKTTKVEEEAAVPEIAKPDMMAIKAEIQTLENAWAKAHNESDAPALAAMYADDAQSLTNNKPAIIGKAEILKDIEANLSKKEKGSTIAFDVADVFGNENQVTEVGKTTIKDAAGKVTYTGKYMAIWEKRDGKYICLRDISNDDAKEK